MHFGISLFQFYEGQVGGAGEYIARLVPHLLQVMNHDDRLYLCGSEANLEPFLELNDPRLESVQFQLAPKTIRLLRIADLLLPGKLTRFLSSQINDLSLDVMLFPQQSLFPQGIRAPKVVTVVDLLHEHFPEQFGLIERKIRFAKDRQLAEGSQHLISISEATQNDLLRVHSLNPENCSVVRLGGNANRVGTHSANLPADTAAPYVFYPANNYPHKNHDTLIRAFERFREECPQLPGRLIMSGRVDKRMQNRISMSPACGDIEHRGFVTPAQLDELYAGCKAVFFPSRFEGFGIPIIEAMGYAKPIYCSYLPVFRELAGATVRYFNPQSEESMANSLKLAFENPKLSVDLKAYAQIQNRLNWTNCARETYGVLRSVAAEHVTTNPRRRVSRAA